MLRFNHITTTTIAASLLTTLAWTSDAHATHYRGGLMTWTFVDKVGPPTSYPDVQTEMIAMSLSGGPVSQDLALPETGTFIVDSFFDVFTELSIRGGNFNVDSFFDIEYRVSPSSSCEGCWQTEMIAMDLSGSVPGGPSVDVRLSPDQPSTGLLQVTDLPDGTFQIDSFFDIWTEVSIDGGPHAPAANVMRVEMHGSALPEPASLALLGMGGMCMSMRRR